MLLAAGRTNVEKLLAGDAAGKKITKIVVGTSNTAVSEGDTTISGAVAKDIETVDYFSDGHVQFNATLVAGDPSMVIQEIGLYNQDGTLCHRKVVPSINKVSGTTYALSYKIKVQ
ncbi:hypothetical protein [Pinibacter soli]|uniref:Uncharacterized protein n=1 Tax=Pinibacter soli TaxID=3044211 RepID=A0ABT6RC83_9BACT|nr:hypothetical protein [Pinibacter soli]MDI3320001.1 hypothetical protein [Pinibacter soli]